VLLIVGIDGATWDVAEALIAAGRMPNLAALRAGGVWGPLASTVPPATFPSWSTFATGVNPGRHGIFDFTRRVFGTYEVTFINSTFRAAPSIWRRLSDQGKRVGVLGLPGTYPPEPVNGCMISGFDTPVTTRADASFIYPRELAALVEAKGGFPFADFQEFRIGADWYRMASEQLLEGIDAKTSLAIDLLRREPWDSFLLLYGESDTVAHHFWKFHDAGSPRFEPCAHEYGDAINKVYERLDSSIGRLIDAAEPQNILVVSDHGFGGAGRKNIHLNHWLAEHGYQKRLANNGGGLSSTLKRLALRMIPASLQATAFRLNGGRWASRLESRARFNGISWPETTAFSEELNYFPSIWLNLEGREPQGVVASGDYRRVVDDVCADLCEGLIDPETRRSVVRHAWRRDELYHGDHVQYAPDIILDLELDAGYSYNCLSSASTPGTDVFSTFQIGHSDGGKLAGMSGSHRSDGLFVMAGKDVGGLGRIQGAAIADMAPTIMNLAGADLPRGLDGRLIEPRDLNRDPADPVEQDNANTPQPYSDAEESEIAARLEALGYID